MLLLALFGLWGCYKATNYPDPSGPIYRGHYGEKGAPVGQPPGDSSRIEMSVGPTLRVVTFNIAYGRRIDLALEVLQSESDLASPDVLALQEMDASGVDRIARALRLNYVYFPSGLHPKDDRDFGCALLSPWPLEEPRKIVLPHGARITGLQRVVAVATLVRGEERLRLYSVHLPSPVGVSGVVRREHLEMLLADAQAAPGPVIIAGDFNTEDAGTLFLEGGFDWPTQDLGLTTDFLGIGFAYDHVFTRGLDLVPGRASRGIVEDNRQASDHLPVWVVLEPK